MGQKPSLVGRKPKEKEEEKEREARAHRKEGEHLETSRMWHTRRCGAFGEARSELQRSARTREAIVQKGVGDPQGNLPT